jgi:hypothetical protein
MMELEFYKGLVVAAQFQDWAPQKALPVQVEQASLVRGWGSSLELDQPPARRLKT